MKNRILHRYIAWVIFLPVLFIVWTGIFLQLKGWIPAIQPKSQHSSSGTMDDLYAPIGWKKLLEAAQSVPEASTKTWADIKNIDVRPALGVARVRAKNGYEVQVDLADGKVLQAAPRLTTTLIEMHEGDFFGESVRLFIFLPAAILLFGLTITGIQMLFFRRRTKPRSTS